MDVAPATDPRYAPLRRGERLALVAFFAVLMLFGILVEHRSAFQHTRKGDLNVFLRAGWAVRSGADLYAVTDDNGFHYHYPPLLAILAAPLADPPAGADRTAMLPYAVSVAVCYLLNLVCLAFAVHHLARALEKTTSGVASAPRGQWNWPIGSRGWWALRLTPILACIIPIGHTLSRGQINVLLLALFAGFLADLIHGRHFRAGLWLSGAVCIKIIPAYLLLLPMWRRDYRCLCGCVAGLVLGLVLVPVVFLGPRRTVDCYREMTRTVLLPGLGRGDDTSRSEELTDQTATEGQSLLTALHNTLHYDQATRPHKASPTLRFICYAIGGMLTLTAVGAFGWRSGERGRVSAPSSGERGRVSAPSSGERGRVSAPSDGIDIMLFFGLLVLNMLLISPVCHLHYYSLLLPLVMALAADRWQKRGDVSLGPWLWGILLIHVIGDFLPQLPEINIFRDCGSAMYGSLLLWLMGVVVLWRRRLIVISDASQKRLAA